jgi:5-methylcytosine-specific restriction endonuclease McrA
MNCLNCGRPTTSKYGYCTRTPECNKLFKREAARAWYWKDPDKGREISRNWYLQNPDKSREASREWKVSNPGKLREYERVRWESLTEEEREAKRKTDRDYYQRNADKKCEYQVTYREANPEKVRENRRRREVRLRQVPNEHIDERWLFMVQGGRCGICRDHMEAWHLDHIIPLSANGWHVYANVRLTHPACNQAKSDANNWASADILFAFMDIIQWWTQHPEVEQNVPFLVGSK